MVGRHDMTVVVGRHASDIIGGSADNINKDSTSSNAHRLMS